MSVGRVCYVDGVVLSADNRFRTEHNRWRLAMSETGTQQSTRYCGALLWTHRRIVTPCLYQTWSATSSQCKSACRTWDSPRSNLLVPLTRRATSFSTRYSFSVTDLGALASTMLQTSTWAITKAWTSVLQKCSTCCRVFLFIVMIFATDC